MANYTIHPLHCGTMIRGSERMGLHFNPGVPFTYPVIAWYLTDGKRKIMIDNGGPPDCPVKQPYEQKEEQRVQNQMAKFGVAPEEIEAVVITHLHWDHTFNNELFTNAKFYVQARELEYSVNPLPIHRLTYCHWRRYLRTDYTVLEGDADIAPGVRALLTPGHTPGSQSVSVETEAGTFVLISDLTNLDEFWEAVPKVPNGVHHDLSDTFRSFAKVEKIADYVLTGHDPQVLRFDRFPNGAFPRRQNRGF